MDSNSISPLNPNSINKFTSWDLIKAYWQSNQKKSAYLFLIVILSLAILVVGMAVVFNYWYSYFYNALQAYDKPGTIKLLIIFFILAAIHMVIVVYSYYITQLFSLRWRRWLTVQFINRWLQRRDYYYLETFDNRTDNPDQRIQEDVFTLVTSTLDLTVGLVTAFTTFVGFIYILWTLSGVFTLPTPWGSFQIPGYLVWVGLIYSAVGTYFTFIIGKPLVNLNFEQQRREANFRYAAMDLRVHSEHVALYKGEQYEKNILEKLFSRVLENYYFLITRQKLLLWFTSGYNQTAVVLPLMVVLPNYFGKVFLLGGLMQSLQAFSKVQDSLSYLVNSYAQIAQWRAVNKRLTSFVNHIDEIDTNVEANIDLCVTHHSTPKIVTHKLTIFTPRKEKLLENIHLEFEQHRNYLIHGDSGIGKSTFVKVLAGIWPFASGDVVLPEKSNPMYLPQKPFMPIGPLAEAILFPYIIHPEWAEKLQQMLHKCNLEHLIPRLHDNENWSEKLSPGEQQRIAFIRVLFYKPNWLFLDESTSMLDLQNEKYMYELIRKELPGCSVISLGHRASLNELHDSIINMNEFISREKTTQKGL